MRKMFLTLAVIACVCVSYARDPQRGYRGFVDLELAAGKFHYTPNDKPGNEKDVLGMFGISTTQGYQFNNHMFAGVGVGVVASPGRGFAPIFGNFRYDARFGKFTPYGDIRLGYEMFENGVYFSPTVGYRFNFGHKLNLNVGLGMSVLPFTYNVDKPKYESGFTLRIGIDF